ncbi:MAG TPA: amino acid adenylation domain-containing protein [Anaerolineae bacterium]|nr:amino acid adenylation domain-containing protein [Anaerolineae bacterium]
MRQPDGGCVWNTLNELLRWRAQQQPDQIAFTFLVDGETEEIDLTYAELDRRARAIGARLQQQGLVGRQVLLLYPQGLEYLSAFFGCLYAGNVAVPSYPPRLNRPDPRLQAIAADAQPAAALTVTEMLNDLESRIAHTPDLKELHWIATDSLGGDWAEQWREPGVTGDALAFLQYTSGSTSTPKGVMVTQANLLHNLEMLKRAYALGEQPILVSWLPLFHDMGLIAAALETVYAGGRCVLMSPASFVQRPFRWLRAISHYRACFSASPNFGYDLCVRHIAPHERETLDLSGWQMALNGAEPVRPQSLERFAETFAPCGFRREALYPGYGLAEATVFVSLGSKGHGPVIQSFKVTQLERHQVVAATTGDEDARRLVGCGHAWLDEAIAIVDPETLTRCAPGRVGEIWVSGPHIARGYWHRPDETARTFDAHLSDTGEGPFLRTGDLGFVHDGELFITGRLKDLIIMRGLNHYPQDIELTVENAHPALQPNAGAAFSVDVGDEERLVVMQEVRRDFREVDAEQIVEAIRQAVTELHELQVYAVVLLKPKSIPKTSSGKIQRRACRALFLDGRLEALATSILEPMDTPAGENIAPLKRETLLAAETEERAALARSYLEAQIARVLRRSVPALDAAQPVSRLGLDSLMAVELANAIERDLGSVVSMVSFLDGSSLAAIAEQAIVALNGGNDLSRHYQGSEAPLSVGQQALWSLYKMSPQSAAYNLAGAIRIREPLDVAALRSAFQTLIERHAVLRTTFALVRGEPVQRIHARPDVFFQAQAAAAWNADVLAAHLAAEAYRPFDLEHGPLLRVHLFTRSADEHILLLALHHSVTDFWSLTNLFAELGPLYRAACASAPAALPPLDVQYTDFVRWQADMLAGAEGEALWAYWKERLSGALPVLNLPTDYPRPPIQTYRGAQIASVLSAELTRRLEAFSAEQRVTLYTTLLAAFQVLLHRYTGQDDIVVGSPMAGRSRAGFADVGGYFVNPVALRADLAGDPTFAGFLAQVRRSVLDALRHQDFPFATLVERLHPERDSSRSPIFQVMFTFQQPHRFDAEGLAALALGIDGGPLAVNGLSFKPVALEGRVSQFDLTLTAAQVNGELAVTLKYNTDLFDSTTMKRWLGHWQTLLESSLSASDRPVSTLNLLTETERRQLLVDWNDTRVERRDDRCIHERFQAQVERTPEAVALVFEDRQLTYRELNEQANQLARHLRPLGVGPEVLVGLCFEQSLEMIVGVLGVLKAGGAYVPLEPTYPQERLEFLLEDTRLPVLLTHSSLLARLPAERPQVVCLDTDWETIARESTDNLDDWAALENLVYVIYTSGSTGRPKGVMVEHRQLVNYVDGVSERIDFPAGASYALVSTVAADLGHTLIYPAVCSGGTLHIIAGERLANPERMADYFNRQPIDCLKIVPSHLSALLSSSAFEQSLRCRRLILGGEALSLGLAEHLQAILFDGRLFNHYGPTETTVGALACLVDLNQIDQRAATVPIGRPLANVQVYVLDDDLRPVPVGVPGQVYIGGEGVSRGYLNRPDLTAERFVPNPYMTIDDGRKTNDNLCPSSSVSRLYKTGDLARYLPDGSIEFLGRADFQVKIRGYRVELGEVEAALAQHPAVRQAVVVAHKEQAAYQDRFTDPPAASRLAAYVVLDPLAPISIGDLRAFAQEQLPEYMVPAAIAFLDKLPLTSNGKVDRAALPALDVARADLDGKYESPRSPIEEVLARMWANLLGVDRVGVHDNFFELGGHSLMAVQAMAQLQDLFAMEEPLIALFFENPTVAGLAEALIQTQARDGNVDKIVETLNLVASLSDEEVEAMLANLGGDFIHE